METENFSFTALKFSAVLGLAYGFQLWTGFDPSFSASSPEFLKFFTSVIGHSDLEHLFNNLFFLSLFGSVYELHTSGENFLATFFVAALFANLSAFIFFPESSIIGASGGATGVMAALAVFRPRQIGLALGVPLPMWAALGAYLFINFAGLSGNNSIAYEAHLMGLLAGAVIGYRLRDRPYLEEDEEDQQEVEEIEWRKRIREWEEKWMM